MTYKIWAFALVCLLLCSLSAFAQTHHQVVAGETLWGISRHYKIKFEALHAANPNFKEWIDKKTGFLMVLIRPGDIVIIPESNHHTTTRGSNISTPVAAYGQTSVALSQNTRTPRVPADAPLLGEKNPVATPELKLNTPAPAAAAQKTAKASPNKKAEFTTTLPTQEKNLAQRSTRLPSQEESRKLKKGETAADAAAKDTQAVSENKPTLRQVWELVKNDHLIAVQILVICLTAFLMILGAYYFFVVQPRDRSIQEEIGREKHDQMIRQLAETPPISKDETRPYRFPSPLDLKTAAYELIHRFADAFTYESGSAYLAKEFTVEEIRHASLTGAHCLKPLNNRYAPSKLCFSITRDVYEITLNHPRIRMPIRSCVLMQPNQKSLWVQNLWENDYRNGLRLWFLIRGAKVNLPVNEPAATTSAKPKPWSS